MAMAAMASESLRFQPQKFQSRNEIYISPLPTSEPIGNILEMFEQVGTIKLNSSLEKTYSYRVLYSGLNIASCRITYTEERAARKSISRFNGRDLNGVRMRVCPALVSYLKSGSQIRSPTDWDCSSCQSLNFDYQHSCYQCRRSRDNQKILAGSSRSQQERERGYSERHEGEGRRNSKSPAAHRRSGEDRDRGYGRSSDTDFQSHGRKSKSPVARRREDKSSEGDRRDPRSPRGPKREPRFSDHQRPRERREEQRSSDCQKNTGREDSPVRRPYSRGERKEERTVERSEDKRENKRENRREDRREEMREGRRSPGRREKHLSGSSGASKRHIESPHRDFKREKSSGGKRLRHEDDPRAGDEYLRDDILNTVKRWVKVPFSVKIQIKPRLQDGGEDQILINNQINNNSANGGSVNQAKDPDTDDQSESFDDEKMKKEDRQNKSFKKRKQFAFEEDMKIVDIVLKHLGDNRTSSFDIPARGLEQLSSELNREEKSIQSRWRYHIREWIKQDEENDREDWHNHGKAALDRRDNITGYFKRQTERRRT